MDVQTQLAQQVQSLSISPAVQQARSAKIHAELLRESRFLDQPNFTVIHPDDLEKMFNAYDREYFAGQIRPLLGKLPLRFSLSRRMTSAGGKTITTRNRRHEHQSYEISVSTAILFNCFREDDHRAIITSGIRCTNRLEALQRVMEHEIVHLLEMLLWRDSSCSQPRFHSITRRYFGHTENKHQLITPKERAMAKFGILPGMKVRFRFDGAEKQGVVNRINKRATVLVEDTRGIRYSDGKVYTKYYVPVQSLQAIK